MLDEHKKKTEGENGLPGRRLGRTSGTVWIRCRGSSSRRSNAGASDGPYGGGRGGSRAECGIELSRRPRTTEVRLMTLGEGSGWEFLGKTGCLVFGLV